MAMYENYKDSPHKLSRFQKKMCRRLFRRAGKQLLDNAPYKYVGVLVWYY